MTASDNCGECGAPQFAGARCVDCFHGLLAFENEHPPAFGAVHHLTVASYYLQHPRGYKTEALEMWRSAIADSLAGRAGHRDLRRRARARFEGATRVRNAAAISPPGWPMTWPVVILDVYDPRNEPPDAASYVERARAWAASVISQLDEWTNAAPG